MVVGSSKKREGAGEGSCTHPQAQTQLLLGAPGWGGAGLGEGEGESLGGWSSGLLRRPRQCLGEGEREEGGGAGGGRGRMRGRGRAGPSPHAGTRKERAHSQIAVRPAGPDAQAQGERPCSGKAALGLWGPAAGYSRAAKAVWSRGGRGGDVTLLTLCFLSPLLPRRRGGAHSGMGEEGPECEDRRPSGGRGAVGGSRRGWRPLTRTLLPPIPQGRRGLRWPLRPRAPGPRSPAFPGTGRAAARSHELASAGHSGAAPRVCLLLSFSLSFPNLGLEMTL